MNHSFHPVIVVGRQYGSGGRRVARLLAERLEAEYFDKELLSQAARHMGYDPMVFSNADERRPSLLGGMWLHSFGNAGIGGDNTLSGAYLLEAQGNVVREIVADRPAIFVGRGVDYILREHPKLISIFLHAPLDHRAESIVERKDASDHAKARELARQKDRERETFYNYFTGRRWGKADNYDLCLNTSTLNDSSIADIIIAYAKSRGFA